MKLKNFLRPFNSKGQKAQNNNSFFGAFNKNENNVGQLNLVLIPILREFWKKSNALE